MKPLPRPGSAGQGPGNRRRLLGASAPADGRRATTYPPDRHGVPIRLPSSPGRAGTPEGRRPRSAARARAVARRRAVLVGCSLSAGAWPAISRSAAASRRRTGAYQSAARGADAAEAARFSRRPRTILLLGSDSGPGREGLRRSDSMVLVRTDPDEHRISMLSIPRDLRVEIPGTGVDKINAAYAFGGARRSTIRTVERLTGLPVNHSSSWTSRRSPTSSTRSVAITVDVPNRIISNPLRLPLRDRAQMRPLAGLALQARDRRSWTGRRALVYSRLRQNSLDPAESDITRGGRQQQVVRRLPRGGQPQRLRAPALHRRRRRQAPRDRPLDRARS